MLAKVRTPSSPVRERERCRICPELLFLFLKGMTGALAPFSYLVANVITRRQLARSMHRDLNHRDHGIHIESALMKYDTLLHYLCIVVTVSSLFSN